uniref:Methyltransferase type 11 domain-containing protein n=1 Tax=Oryza meridionalis TaxID=40149 RepID=A0A0E0CRF1_9ORYZ
MQQQGAAALTPATGLGSRPSLTVKTSRVCTTAALPPLCRCGRRHLIVSTSATALLPLLALPSPAASPVDPEVMLERVHPARPEWYEKFYATAMDKFMKPYEAEIAQYKSKLFSQLMTAGKNILELGVGTGPNLKYYANADGVNIVGVDPNKHMEEYARAAAVSAGLPPSNFTFRRGVGEALPAEDNSMDAVVGTLVMCSVSDVEMALREIKRVLKPGGLYIFIEHVAAPDGSFLRFVQGALNPLQQFVSDGCHLTRETGEIIREAGFSSLDLNTTRLSTAFILSPHVYGVACK